MDLNTDEKRLLSALKNGDIRAFDAIFRKYASKLYFFSFDKTHNEAEAEEIVQETFMKVWETRAAIDPGLNFGNYLITIAKNKIYNTFRRRLVERKYSEAAVSPEIHGGDVEQELYTEDLRRLLLRGIDGLSPQ